MYLLTTYYRIGLAEILCSFASHESAMELGCVFYILQKRNQRLREVK